MLYKKYCNDYLECPYCNKTVNTYYAKTHLKSKSCIELQNMLSDEIKKNLLLFFTKEINKLKGELRLIDD